MGEVTSCAALFEVWSGGMQMQIRLFCTSVPICCGTEVHSGLFCTCVPRLILRNHWNSAVSLKAGCVVPWWPCGMQMQIRLFCMCVPICCGTEVHSGLFCTCVPRLISWDHWNFAVSLKAGCVVLRDASAESVILHVRPVSALYPPRIITGRKRVSGSCATCTSPRPVVVTPLVVCLSNN